MKLKLKRINLHLASVFAVTLLCAQASAALVNSDFAQPGVPTGAAAVIAEDFTPSVLRHEEIARLDNGTRGYVYRVSSDANLQTFSSGVTDRLTLKLAHDAGAADVHGPSGGLVNVSVAAVPEPVPLTFIGIGAVALVGIQALRRRRT